jgi:Protein of unknown function (DUF2917)
MNELHQTQAALLSLGNGHVRRLRLREPHELRVSSGRLWLTLDGRPGAPADDVLLQRGDRWLLPAGCDAVLEALPVADSAQARFDLLLTR